ncbi:MAG TPA: hypothetical protein VLE97_11420 [Gaiellaceae bacterium]|nr:hypothetical protein [Gaiellaceae bacterium]
MTDDEWEEQRRRAVLAAFQTGRPVFADTDGELRYVDGDREPLADDVGMPKTALPSAEVKITWWGRIRRWFVERS